MLKRVEPKQPFAISTQHCTGGEHFSVNQRPARQQPVEKPTVPIGPFHHRGDAESMGNRFVRLRGVYIKLGQILSVMGTFLPREYTEELEALQDDVPPQSYKKVRKTFVKSFGKQPHEVFASFAQVPIAAASLGQVHEARTATGERLAVKILYPNVVTIIKVDLRVLGWALKIYRNFVPLQQIERVHEQLADMLARETDLANEARCIDRMARNFVGDPDVVFPKIYPEWSSTTVMTMSFMDAPASST